MLARDWMICQPLPEGMLALERHLLGLEDANAFAEASGILEQVTLDLSILKPLRPHKHQMRRQQQQHQGGGGQHQKMDQHFLGQGGGQERGIGGREGQAPAPGAHPGWRRQSAAPPSWDTSFAPLAAYTPRLRCRCRTPTHSVATASGRRPPSRMVSISTPPAVRWVTAAGRLTRSAETHPHHLTE